MTRSDSMISNAQREFARFCADDNGATAIEYAMVASGIGAFLAATVYQLGGRVKTLFTTLAGMF